MSKRIWIWVLAGCAALAAFLAWALRLTALRRVAAHAALAASRTATERAHDAAIAARVRADEAQAKLDEKIDAFAAARRRHEMSADEFAAKWGQR